MQSRTHWSKELRDLRRQEKVFFSVKDYERAEQLRIRGDKLEARERETISTVPSAEIVKRERLLRKRQQLALGTLLKRI
jgi:hypothetical protein